MSLLSWKYLTSEACSVQKPRFQEKQICSNPSATLNNCMFQAGNLGKNQKIFICKMGRVICITEHYNDKKIPSYVIFSCSYLL